MLNTRTPSERKTASSIRYAPPSSAVVSMAMLEMAPKATFLSGGNGGLSEGNVRVLLPKTSGVLPIQGYGKDIFHVDLAQKNDKENESADWKRGKRPVQEDITQFRLRTERDARERANLMYLARICAVQKIKDKYETIPRSRMTPEQRAARIRQEADKLRDEAKNDTRTRSYVNWKDDRHNSEIKADAARSAARARVGNRSENVSRFMKYGTTIPLPSREPGPGAGGKVQTATPAVADPEAKSVSTTATDINFTHAHYGWSVIVIESKGRRVDRTVIQPLEATSTWHQVPGTGVELPMQRVWLFKTQVGGQPRRLPAAVGMLPANILKPGPLARFKMLEETGEQHTVPFDDLWIDHAKNVPLGKLGSTEPAGVVGCFDLGEGFSLHCPLPSTVDKSTDDKPLPERVLMIVGCEANSTLESTPFGWTVEYFEQSDETQLSADAALPDDTRRDIEDDVGMFKRARGSALYSNVSDLRAISFLAHDRNVDVLTPSEKGRPVSEAFEQLRQCGLHDRYTSIKVWRDGSP